MAYIDFPAGNKGNKERKDFWLSPDGIELISSWRREGIPIEEISSKYIGIGTTTMWRWTKESSELELALGISQDITNSKVEKALLKRALGYDYEEVQTELIEGELRIAKVTTKHVPPDVKACLSWLYSRRSDRWRAVQEPIDSVADEVKTAKKILVAIKEVADSGDTGTTEQKTD